MSRASRPWTLPGPAAFVRMVAQTANDKGVAVIIAPPHCLSGVDAAVEASLHQSWMPTLDAGSDEPPLAALSRAFDVDVRSAAALPVDRATEGKVVVVAGLDSSSWPRWETTLRAWAAGCTRRQRFGAILIGIVAPACENVINSAGLQSLPWKGVIGSRDAMLWALDRVPVTLDPLLGRLAVETAVSLAGWDIELAASFVEDFVATPRRMFDVSRIPSGAARAGRWVDGTFDMLDGVAFPALGCCCQEEVMRRFWRAQVTVLFGWLETERSLFVRRHNRALLECVRRLHPPAADLDAMEWAEISRLMKVAFAAGDRQVELANEARLARNALAHLQSIDYARFARIRSLARDNSSKRGDAAA